MSSRSRYVTNRDFPIFMAFVALFTFWAKSASIADGVAPERFGIERSEAQNTTTFKLDGPPIRSANRFYPANPACTSANVDLWFAGGQVSFINFLVGEGPKIADSAAETDSISMTIGDKGCRIRVRIERED